MALRLKAKASHWQYIEVENGQRAKVNRFLDEQQHYIILLASNTIEFTGDR